MPTPFPPLSVVFATDEAICVRAVGDYMDLCPAWQRRAVGNDGAFAAGRPWVLTSAAVNFASSGVSPNGVVALTGPRPNFVGTGELFAVDAVAGNSLTLRRVGEQPGVGWPPGPANGLTGVSFECRTFAPQIQSCSYEVRKRFGIDQNTPGNTDKDLYDPQELEQITVLSVLVRLYAASNRSRDGDWALKLKLYADDLREYLDRVTVKWGASGQGEQGSGRWGTRVRR